MTGAPPFGTSQDTDFAAIIEPVARNLLGEPNHKLSNGKQLRFGTHGSIAVEIGGDKKGTWFDHEANEGGGTLDLLRSKKNLIVPDAIRWLEEHQFIPRREKEQQKPKFKIVAAYDYKDADGKLLFHVVRLDPKDFRQHRPDGVWTTAGIKKVPYRLPELLAAPLTAMVYIAEGEKDVDALRQRRLVATCNPGGAETSGASKWTPSMSDSLRGRDVAILPDNDEAGEKHAANIANSLKGKAKSVRIVRLPNLPPKGDVSDWLTAGGTAEELERLAREAPEQKQEPETDTTANFPLLTIADLEAMPDPVWLVDDILVADSLCVLYGPWGSFKSFIALHGALCLATGTPFYGRAVVKSDVVYIAGEGAGGIKKRVAAWQKHHGIKDIPGFRVVPMAVNLLDRAEAERLIKTVLDAHKADGFNPKLAIVDTLHRSMPGGDENAAKEMGIVISNGAHIQCQLGCALMPVHHSGKDFDRGMRGSSGLPGASDTILRMTREEGSKNGTLLVEKQKDGEDGQELHVKAEVVDLPPAAGSLKPRNSLVLVATEAPSGANWKGGKPKKPKGDAGIGLRVLADTIVNEGEPLPVTSGFPTTPMRGATELAWRREFYRRISDRTQDAKKKAFGRMMRELRDAGLVGFCDSRVWLVTPETDA